MSLPEAAYKEKWVGHSTGIPAFPASDQRIKARDGCLESSSYLLSPVSLRLQVSGIIIQRNVLIAWDTSEKIPQLTLKQKAHQPADALGTALPLISLDDSLTLLSPGRLLSSTLAHPAQEC